VKREVWEELREAARCFGFDLDRRRLGLFERYADLLLGYREANVVGVRDLRTLVRKHFVDSLSCLLVEGVRRAGLIADVGSGGGLPGVPVKIVRSGAGVVLIEATSRKCVFLRRVVEELGLEGIEVENGRAEELARRDDLRGLFDAVLVRAVAELPVVAEYSVPFLREGGVLVAMKGRISGEELTAGALAATELGAGLEEVREVPEVPGVFEGMERRLVVIRKRGVTPVRYPRRAGVPRKRPLGVTGGS
jgi:16S rRNA (guanine527-N7)-methyltransferase